MTTNDLGVDIIRLVQSSRKNKSDLEVFLDILLSLKVYATIAFDREKKGKHPPVEKTPREWFKNQIFEKEWETPKSNS